LWIFLKKTLGSGTHLKGYETSFQMVPPSGTIIFEILPLLGELYHFKGLMLEKLG
jgi:hypothetical protein